MRTSDITPENIQETKKNAVEIAKRWLADIDDDETPLSAIVVDALVQRVGAAIETLENAKLSYDVGGNPSLYDAITEALEELRKEEA